MLNKNIEKNYPIAEIVGELTAAQSIQKDSNKDV